MLRTARVAFAIALLAVLFGFDVHSQEPSPRAGEAAQPQQQDSTAAQGQAAADQRGTENVPLIVKVLPTPKTEDEATQEAKDRDEKAANDRELIRYTRILDIITSILAVVGILQLFVFGWQGIQLKRTVDLAREEFLSTHRPLLKIKFVEQTLSGERLAIRFSVVNAGTSTAHVRASATHVDVFKPDSWPNPNDYEMNDIIGNGRFMIGATVQYEVVSSHVNPLVAYANGASAIRLYGYIVYDDDAGTPRTTYFCRVHDRENDRFTPSGNPDYDSTD